MTETEKTFPESLADATVIADRYVLLHRIAEGGACQVFLTWDRQDRHWWALKRFSAQYLEKGDHRERFVRETAAMATLSHPNILKVEDHGLDNGAGYIVMAVAEGGSVVDWLDRFGPLPPAMAVDAMLQIAGAVKHAHGRSIIHRDIKPQNVLIDRTGRCLLTDFGIARVDSVGRMTETGSVMGTLGYMAPEQHEDAKYIDERADIYGLAATLFTLVTGRSSSHLFMRSANDFDHVEPVLQDIIERATKYRREERYSTVQEFIEALEAATPSLPPIPSNTPTFFQPILPNLSRLAPPDSTTESTGEITSMSATRDVLLTRPPSEEAVYTPYSSSVKKSRFSPFVLSIASFFALFVVGLFFVTAKISANTLQRNEDRVLVAHQAWIEGLLEERAILQELQQLGSKRVVEVKELLHQVETTSDREIQASSAKRAQSLVAQERHELFRDAPPSQIGVLRRIEHREQRVLLLYENRERALLQQEKFEHSVTGKIGSLLH